MTTCQRARQRGRLTPGGRETFRWRILSGWCQRENEGEGGALTLARLDPDAAAVEVHELAADGQPEAGAGDVAGAGGVSAGGGLEQPRDHGGRGAGAGGAHRGPAALLDDGP